MQREGDRALLSEELSRERKGQLYPEVRSTLTEGTIKPTLFLENGHDLAS